ncbi:MAG: hypothetical protein EZS28_009448 [Streblomastix strix]|uniref:Uncharacterized protein n=1 Tax=Streblomastix strix TaxID=222440 RepID=A0A5J4WJ56_9EUKA|nr:MAG: hypothetical protein EZS28_009448 [Streblomastix strix]
MSFKSSDYLARLQKKQHSDYVAGYIQLGEQQFTDQPVTELTSSGVKYIRAPSGARGIATCSIVQACQVIQTIIILKDTLAMQLNETNEEEDDYNKRINYNGNVDPLAAITKDKTQGAQNYYGKQADRFEKSKRLSFWLGFSTAYGSFHQFQLMREGTALLGTTIYAREYATISSNSLSDLCTTNSVSVSPLEIPQPYDALTQTVNGLMFDCFVDQDVVIAPSDLYHSLTFENINCQDKGGFYGNGDVNVFVRSKLFEGTKVTKTLYPNIYMLAWKLATDDSFM